MNASPRRLVSIVLCGLALCVGCVLAQEPGAGRDAGGNESSARPSVEAEAEAVAAAEAKTVAEAEAAAAAEAEAVAAAEAKAAAEAEAVAAAVPAGTITVDAS